MQILVSLRTISFPEAAILLLPHPLDKSNGGSGDEIALRVFGNGKTLNMLIQVSLRAVHKEICKKGSDTDLTEISFKCQFKLEPHPHWPPSGV